MMFIDEAAAKLAAALGGTEGAALAARALVEADALGQPRFGVAMCSEFSQSAATAPQFQADRSVQWVDCANNFAPLAVAEACLHLARVTPQLGVAAVFLRGVKGFGRLAPFMRHLADAGLLGMAGAEGPPFVSAFGGASAVIGTNPFALGVGQGRSQVVIDMATSSATMAEVKGARLTGQPLKAGIAVDGKGQPTTVAADVAALLPRGGQLGSLLGLVVELLAGVAGGGRDDPKGRGVFLLALDPSQAGEGVDWPSKLAGLQRDWQQGGGYWPKGGHPITGPIADPDFEARLEAQLAHISTAKAARIKD